MDGYDETTYGEAFADVYDDWYRGVSDVASTVTTLVGLATDVADARTPARILELGVGTGRLAVPMAIDHRDAVSVTGVDTSTSMLELLARRDPGSLVDARLGDMVAGLPDGPFELALVAYNTLFNLTGDGEQQRCFEAVAARLVAGGRFVVEAFVPDRSRDGDDVGIRSMTADRVVLSVSRHHAADQRAEGHFVELTDRQVVRLRPWSIRYATPAQLDVMADRAGFELERRWADMSGTPFDDQSERHVTVYRRA